jgi:hypothetical protein
MQRIGRIHRQVRRCFIAAAGSPVRFNDFMDLYEQSARETDDPFNEYAATRSIATQPKSNSRQDRLRVTAAECAGLR